MSRKSRIALLVLASLAVPVPVQAQDAASNPVADSPPSLRGFSLPPSRPKPDTATQGPVDSDTTPPRTITRPGSPATAAPAPSDTPRQVQPARAATVRPSPAPVASPVTAPAAKPSIIPVDPDTPVSSDDPPAETPLPNALPAASPSDGSVMESAPARSLDWSIWAAALALVVLLLGAFTLLFNKLRRAVAPDTSPVADADDAYLLDSLAPPAVATEPETLPDLAPAPAQETQTLPVLPAPAFGDAVTLQFTALSASTTLVNMVIGFQLDIRNTSGGTLTDIRVCGDMIAATKARSADGLLPRDAAELTVIADIAYLPADAEHSIVGDMRVPLSGIEPLRLDSRALFVPLVRLAVVTRLPGGDDSATQFSAYLVGQQQVPPSERLAPLRIDLGPRDFTGIGQRQLLG